MTKDLPTTDVPVSFAVQRWTCSNAECGTSFAIILIVPPNPGDPESSGMINVWGNPDRPPFCPSCGKKVAP